MRSSPPTRLERWSTQDAVHFLTQQTHDASSPNVSLLCIAVLKMRNKYILS